MDHEQRDRGESKVDCQHHGELNVSKWNVKHIEAKHEGREDDTGASKNGDRKSSDRWVLRVAH